MLSGGIALNCIASSKALNESPYKNMHVPPCPNDTGLALGMALFAAHDYSGIPWIPKWFSPYTGPVYNHSSNERLATPDSIADLIANNECICIWQQRSECGPRALGHRSIICKADLLNGRSFLNEKVKNREWYRPFAAMIMSEHAASVLEGNYNNATYMTTSSTIKPEWRNQFSAASHIDNTTRPQIVSDQTDLFMHSILCSVYNKTGIPGVVNTSFNMSEPIVESIDDALKTFKKLPTKHLVLDKYLISK